MKTTIGFIGAGNITSAIIPSIISNEFCLSKDIIIFDIDSEKLEALKSTYDINVASSIEELARKSDIIVVAVKPFVLESVLKELELFIDNQTIISTVAGVTTETILNTLKGNIKLARIMPNIGAMIGESMTALVTKNMENDNLDVIHKFFLSFGTYITLEEKHFNEFTTLCGSSPAFFADIFNTFITYGMSKGIDEKSVRKMVLSTIQGTAKILMSTPLNEEALISKVATKGGTTEAGLNVMKERNLDQILLESFHATTNKAQELSNYTKKS